MMFGLPALGLAMYLNTPKSKRKVVGAILAGVAFTSFLTGITEPFEFLFLFVAPILFVAHALLTGLSLALAQLMGIHHGFGFSAGFIDYIINYKLATKPLLILPLGLFIGFIYFITGYFLLKFLKVNLFKELERDEPNTGEAAKEPEQPKEKDVTLSAQAKEAQLFIQALGGKENILDTDACITRLRMTVKDSADLNDEGFKALGAKGVIRPDKSTIQIVLGTKAEKVAEEIKEALGKS
jgi:PTS system N-acetylglucosamine-specific IIC component